MRSLVAQGAEARILVEENCIVKDRFAKSYRLPIIDAVLRKSRTRREAKVLEKLEKIKFPAPRLKRVDDVLMRIEMELVQGRILRDVLHTNPVAFGEEVGKKVAVLHAAGIIHGDLTTSNMILRDKVVFIDFGLSFFSEKVEDKAVDVHVFEEALEAKHHELFDECFAAFKKGYLAMAKDGKSVFARLEKVRARGRNKGKSGENLPCDVL